MTEFFKSFLNWPLSPMSLEKMMHLQRRICFNRHRTKNLPSIRPFLNVCLRGYVHVQTDFF